MKKKECVSCIFCDRESNTCRINPPVLIFGTSETRFIQYETRWPTVKNADWCGKFQPRPTIQNNP